MKAAADQVDVPTKKKTHTHIYVSHIFRLVAQREIAKNVSQLLWAVQDDDVGTGGHSLTRSREPFFVAVVV